MSCWTSVLCWLHSDVGEAYSEAPQAGTPPVQLAVNVTDCPLLIVGFDGLIDGVDKAGLTVISLFTEFTVTGVVALSVTNMQQYVVEVGDTELNDALPLVKEDKVWTKVDPVLQVEVVDEYSFAVQSVVPPDHDEVNDTDCPESIVGLDGLIDGVVRAALSVNVADFMELVDSGVVALSFMRTFP